ncbi:hypothetical protein BH10PSE17_BH10PSE17_04720 [soil metagenome]
MTDADAIRLIRASAATLVRSSDLRRIRGLRAGTVGFDRSAWRAGCEMGWPALRVSAQAGGLGLDVTALCAVAQELGAGLVPEPYLAMATIAPLLPEQTLQKVLAGDCIVLPATQESPDALLEGRATTCRAGKLFGTKRFVANAEGADAFLVSTDTGLALVDRHAPGLELANRRTQDGGWSATLRFDGAPATPIDGDFDAAREEMTLATAFYLLGAMERAFQMTLDYTQQRRQFDQTIASFQSVRHRLADLKIQLEITRATLDWTARQLDAGVSADERLIAVSRAKARASSAAMLIANDTVQFHGGMGYTDEGDIGLYCRKILATYNACGSAAAHRRRCFALGAITPSVDELLLPQPDAPLPDDLNSLSDDEFRGHVRVWLEHNYPRDLPRFPTCMPRRATTKVWYDRLTAKGWLAPGWPRQHGGMELSTDKRIVMLEEFDRFGCARFNDQGVLMVGPMLMSYGTEAQRERFLPRIMTGEDIWAQGYSEPGAGSDLAALSTAAVLDGDEWVINGQKTWTTLAHDASWLYVLVRTDKSVRKQEGISILLVPTDAAGVTVRSFKTLGMHDEFADVFFDNVRVPASALVGPLNGGWRIAKNLLGFERIFHGSIAQASKAFSRLLSLASALGVDADPVVQADQTALALDIADHHAFYNVCLDAMRRGEDIGPRISMLKVHSSELYKRITRKMIDIAGEHAAIVDESDDTDGISPSALWVQALPATIYGGAVEVQRNIIAQHILDNTH